MHKAQSPDNPPSKATIAGRHDGTAGACSARRKTLEYQGNWLRSDMDSETTCGKHHTVLLWPGVVPGALGDGPQDCPTLTLLTPAGQGPWPCIVICPGGGYGNRADHEGLPVVS